MAEIKSTMDLVMERAARMGRASDEELQEEDQRKEGMKLAADFLDEKVESLMTALAELPEEKQVCIRSGMVDTLLRNIFLHRDEMGKERTEKAAQGIREISGNAGEVGSICVEMQTILGQYNQHREQLHQQLEEQIRMQYEQIMAQQAQQAGMQGGANLEQILEAKVDEELGKMEAELADQYNQALEQYKGAIRERLS
ncbi:hypothetical protein H206_02181 [Candidatus Electrothrix aarhusensis]|jgi:hypothetical protein|uniref:Uncharacterized protein n=1 Tax=Candidatus Electrothrix aarhusensis TaxID=1859131 RepID=A0A3S3RQK6_9BACT|nr:hypothetical protein H206_02181 [Candidatus Electrothrix aarhusensis]